MEAIRTDAKNISAAIGFETKSAALAAPGAAVAPEKAGSKKVASYKKGAPKSQKNAKVAKPKAAAASQPKKARASARAAKQQ